MTIYGQDCFIGMKIKVDDKGNCSWQPNKFAGNHGARFSLENDGGIGKVVISKYAKGANVRITRDGCLHFRTKDGIEKGSGSVPDSFKTTPSSQWFSEGNGMYYDSFPF